MVISRKLCKAIPPILVTVCSTLIIPIVPAPHAIKISNSLCYKLTPPPQLLSPLSFLAMSISAQLLTPPALFSPTAYAQSLTAAALSRSSTTYAITVSSNYILSCSSTGKISISSTICADGGAYMGSSTSSTSSTSGPLAVIRVAATPLNLYAMDIVNRDSASPLLIVAGDTGLIIYSWTDLLKTLSSLPVNNNNNNNAPAILTPSPLSTCSAHPSVTESSIEITSFSVLPDTNTLAFSAGDTFGVYLYDLATNQFLANITGTTGYLHSTHHIANSTTLVGGGEDGTVDFFDVHQQKLIEKVQVRPYLNKHAASSTDTIPSNAHLWTACVTADTVANGSDFMAACGGIEGTGKNKNKGWISYVQERSERVHK